MRQGAACNRTVNCLTKEHGQHSTLLADCCNQHGPADEACVVGSQQQAVETQLPYIAALPPQLVHEVACKVYDEHPHDKYTQRPAQVPNTTALSTLHQPLAVALPQGRCGGTVRG
jgi:hypothetical protein